GDKVRKEEPLVEIQTDKINVEIPSPAEGTLSSILVPEGTTVLGGTEIAQLGAMGEATAVPVAAAAAKAAAVASAKVTSAPPAPARAAVSTPLMTTPPNGNAQTIESGEGRNLSPSVRKIMREQNVSMTELAAIAGSGLAGRVTRDDLLDYLKRRGASPAGAAASQTAAPPAPRPSVPASAAPLPSFLQPAAVAAGGSGPRETTVPFSRVRKVI